MANKTAIDTTHCQRCGRYLNTCECIAYRIFLVSCINCGVTGDTILEEKKIEGKTKEEIEAIIQQKETCPKCKGAIYIKREYADYNNKTFKKAV